MALILINDSNVGKGYNGWQKLAVLLLILLFFGALIFLKFMTDKEGEKGTSYLTYAILTVSVTQLFLIVGVVVFLDRSGPLMNNLVNDLVFDIQGVLQQLNQQIYNMNPFNKL
jgi:hypothetical protein